MFKKITFLIVFIGVTSSLKCMEEKKKKKPCLQLRAIQWLQSNLQKDTLPSDVIKPIISHPKSIGYKQPPNKNKIGKLSKSNQSNFQKYETLILQAIFYGDITSLQKMIAPLPHKTPIFFRKAHTRFNINTVKTQKGEPVLFIALKSSKALEVIKYLVEQCDADPFLTNNKNSLLHALAKDPNNVDLDLSRYLITHCRLNPYERNNEGYIPLHSAIQCSNQPMIQFFIEECDVNPRTETSIGRNCCDLLIHYYNPTLIAHYITRGKIDPNATNSVGLTPLCSAIKEQNPKATRLLVDHGADFNISNITIGKTKVSALDYAKNYQSRAAQEIFYYFMVQLYKEAMKQNSKCSICHKPIQEGHPKKTFTSCCYQFMCKEDSQNYKKCPLCKAKKMDLIVLKDVKK